MKKAIQNHCLRTVRLLLCIFVFYCSSCSNSRRLSHKSLETSKPILQVVIRESDLFSFMEKTQELNLIPVDFQQRKQGDQNRESNEFWVTFRFVTKVEFLVGRSEIISTGLVSKIVH